MNTKNQLLCTWCGVLFMALFSVGFVFIAQYVPPTAPSATALEVAALYQQNATQIRLGMLITMAGAGFIVPFAAAISAQMMRIERNSHVLSYTQFGSNAMGAVLFIIPAMVWTSVAFRPDRDPEIMLMMNDFAWFSLVMPFTLAVIQSLAVGVAILSDKGTTPIYPRWIGYFSLWAAVLYLPGGLVTFFKSGPFAWNGILAFWIPLAVFGAWFMVMFFYTLVAIKQQSQNDAPNI